MKKNNNPEIIISKREQRKAEDELDVEDGDQQLTIKQKVDLEIARRRVTVAPPVARDAMSYVQVNNSKGRTVMKRESPHKEGQILILNLG
ncbi:hypothetical protein [Herbiconiux daphne]|uniref:Uncharacterized protein n=1 Tax=Herbiconiux daphne TaxID=2970914 RepID=A0ABT2HB21_9MICO|nr:hypothetical protein [Herbiconiux daphne]MCS5737094.1 hypothetical protein [Herbiconiux daphne]